MAGAKVNGKGVAWFVGLAYLFSWAIAVYLYGRSPLLRKEASLA